MLDRQYFLRIAFVLSALWLLVAWPDQATAQRNDARERSDSTIAATVDAMLVRYGDSLGDTTVFATLPTFDSPADSLAWVAWRDRADAARDPLRVVVSIFDRELYVIRASGDTLHRAPIAVASGVTLEYAGRKWTFKTPRGQRRVLRKVTDPVWTPPDWLYAEVAAAYGLKLAHLGANSTVTLPSGRRLSVRNGVVGLITKSGEFAALPVDEHIVFNNTLYIPPFSARNRRVAGELGPFALDMGNGYLIHGTPDASSIGKAVTHGCVRLADPDIAWMYENVPVGTPVYIY